MLPHLLPPPHMRPAPGLYRGMLSLAFTPSLCWILLLLSLLAAMTAALGLYNILSVSTLLSLYVGMLVGLMMVGLVCRPMLGLLSRPSDAPLPYLDTPLPLGTWSLISLSHVSLTGGTCILLSCVNLSCKVILLVPFSESLWFMIKSILIQSVEDLR